MTRVEKTIHVVGFRRVELLVVIECITQLISMLLPDLITVRAPANAVERGSCTGPGKPRAVDYQKMFTSITN